MPDDLLAARCADLATPVMELMAAALGAQTKADSAFADVIRLAQEVKAIAERGSVGIDQTEYVAWSTGAPSVLDAMIDAAERRDPTGVWRAFSDPQYGLHRTAAACAGQPRW